MVLQNNPFIVAFYAESYIGNNAECRLMLKPVKSEELIHGDNKYQKKTYKSSPN